jgi:hypothetical protein
MKQAREADDIKLLSCCVPLRCTHAGNFQSLFAVQSGREKKSRCFCFFASLRVMGRKQIDCKNPKIFMMPAITWDHKKMYTRHGAAGAPLGTLMQWHSRRIQ